MDIEDFLRRTINDGRCKLLWIELLKTILGLRIIIQAKETKDGTFVEEQYLTMTCKYKVQRNSLRCSGQNQQPHFFLFIEDILI
ncbi:hypothetical protein I3842_07G052700 [Carya illinoinensis]|uniref:Uncharacterized protein n=1 Tax=Carya illinoinensis TaxID=32201 RepID=A0A922JFW9_CARIL|nr:hypothetical protein I3842_07G052700 [Carya illinoinensis]